ncbi:hypothetical protein F0562_015527 [Nyssa sinensis]|uniref:Uncharacterized protein n=1 Tax=Nyssa sinensis TaxID=561372 RepID=A0A5J4ZH92_9ASTE|nr:hypothetical protein F0562_015527 [Nyssa sinensis]
MAIVAKWVALADESSSERTESKGLSQCIKVVLPTTMDLLEFFYDHNVDNLESSFPLRAQWGKSMTPFAQGVNNPPLPIMEDDLKMAWNLSWNCMLRELVQHEVNKLKGQILELMSDFSITEIAALATKKMHVIEVKANMTIVKKEKDKILKLGVQFVNDGCNICLMKLAKAIPEFNPDVLEDIELEDEEEVAGEASGQRSLKEIPLNLPAFLILFLKNMM